MPTVTNPSLTLSESNGIVTMTIVYIPTLAASRRSSGPSDAPTTHISEVFTDRVDTEQEVLTTAS